MLVLHHRNPENRPEDQASTFAGLKLAENLPGMRIVHAASTDPYDYAKALEKALGEGDDLAVVEGDLAVMPHHLLELQRCMQPLCVFAYYIYPLRGEVRVPEIVHWDAPDRIKGPIREGDHWAMVVGLGLARMRREGLSGVVARPIIPQVLWRDVAASLSARIARPWHVHWPAVVHHHLGV